MLMVFFSMFITRVNFNKTRIHSVKNDLKNVNHMGFQKGRVAFDERPPPIIVINMHIAFGKR